MIRVHTKDELALAMKCHVSPIRIKGELAEDFVKGQQWNGKRTRALIIGIVILVVGLVVDYTVDPRSFFSLPATVVAGVGAMIIFLSLYSKAHYRRKEDGSVEIR
jgi:L-asparagine transporter-like permease